MICWVQRQLLGAGEPCSRQGLVRKKAALVSGLVVLSKKGCVSNKEPICFHFVRASEIMQLIRGPINESVYIMYSIF